MPDQAVILLAEDNPDDIVLIRKAFQRGNLSNPLHIVRDGEEAIAYLMGEEKYANRAEYPLPDLLLLDLKMPRVDGFEVLRWIRRQPGLSALRVVVLTSSDHIRDVNEAYHLGANSFLVKPMEFEHITETIDMLKRYWLRLSKAPEISRPPKKKISPPGATKPEGSKPEWAP
jgi:CheY-like chemotaxis protein